MKVAFFHHTLKLGSGIDTVIYELANRLSARGTDVAIFCFKTSYTQEQCNFDLRVINSPLANTTSKQMILAPFVFDRFGPLKSHLEKFDILNTHHYPANYIARKLKGPVTVVTEWSGVQPWMFSSLKEQMYIRWVSHANKSAVQHADIVLAPCEFVKNWIMQKYSTSATTMYLDGVNFQVFDRHKIPREALFESHPEIRGKKIILFVGRITESKNVHLLIDILSRIKKDCPDAVLVLVGDYSSYPNYYNSLIEKVRNKHLHNDVFFLGITSWEDLPKYFAACDIYATCSAWEGFLRAEAYAFCKPIVCFDTGANSETVKDGERGFLVKYPEVDKFAEQIQILLRDEALARRLGENGYSWAKKNLDFDVISDNFLKLCTQMI